MIDRYMPADFEEIWSEENMYRTWLRVELEVCRVLAEKGWIPKESMAAIEQKANFSVSRIKEIESITHHDLIAFTTSVAEHVGPDSRYFHWGLTSTDVIDTVGIRMTSNGRHFDIGAGVRDDGRYDDAAEVFGVSGCIALYRTAALLDTHIETGFYGVIQENSVHDFTQGVISAERERQVADPAAHARAVRQG